MNFLLFDGKKRKLVDDTRSAFTIDTSERDVFMCVQVNSIFHFISNWIFPSNKIWKVFFSSSKDSWINLCCLSVSHSILLLLSIHENHPKWWRGFIFHKKYISEGFSLLLYNQKYFQTWLLPVNLYLCVTFHETCSHCVVIYFEYLCVMIYNEGEVWGIFGDRI